MGNVGYGSVGVYFAFIQFTGFTMGKAVSQYSSPWVQYPAGNFDGLPGSGGNNTGVNQFAYIADFGQGFTATVSMQDPTACYQRNIWNTTYATAAGIVTGVYGSASFGGTQAPDFVGMTRLDQAWGLFQARLSQHATMTVRTKRLDMPLTSGGWAGQLALSIKNIPTGAGDTINLQAAYANGAINFGVNENIPASWAMYGNSARTDAYQSMGLAGIADAIYSGATAATGTALQLTTTYGFNGGYTHNWNPYWNTGFYSGWAAVRSTDVAKTQICASSGMAALGLAGVCSSDFNIAGVGTITRWSPVTNLTFSAELDATFLDQKYSGAIKAPAVAGVGKSAAMYELKNQSALVGFLLVQRNW
ncbi:porin [Bradyrhizobium sp. CCBAU 11386]|uniref:porin n=1 Tax=Bradyrhizobium sp. CCBAU 11386 TaxID=1630837 RepID=UPI0023034D25|nr:porin [Bradyrhizobium sp. CCBAU 11386]